MASCQSMRRCERGNEEKLKVSWMCSSLRKWWGEEVVNWWRGSLEMSQRHWMWMLTYGRLVVCLSCRFFCDQLCRECGGRRNGESKWREHVTELNAGEWSERLVLRVRIETQNPILMWIVEIQSEWRMRSGRIGRRHFHFGEMVLLYWFFDSRLQRFPNGLGNGIRVRLVWILWIEWDSGWSLFWRSLLDSLDSMESWKVD